MIITLTVEEYGRAIFTGYERWSTAVRSGREDSLCDRGWVNGVEGHIKGATGELAVAKCLHMYPPLHVNQFRGMRPDLGADIEVRHREKREYQLIVRKDDHDDRKYVLTRGDPPEIEIVGWIWGGEAKKKEYIDNFGGYGEAYFVPDDKLHQIETLRGAPERSEVS